MRTSHACLMAVLLCAGLGAQAADIPAQISKAVADSTRSPADMQRDVNRKPSEVLAFAGVKQGDKVGELMPGRGYFTQIFCRVVGDKGHVYTVSFKPAIKMDRPPPPDVALPAPAAPVASACMNVTANQQAASDLSLPSGLDLVWTSENYHDFHTPMMGITDMKKFNKAIFDALKPGGVYMVEDHRAADGSGARDTESLHRIDSELVKQEVTSAGFVFEASSEALKNADDPHTGKVFDLRGKSDKFLLKFRKPAH
jgi:predicted methyltransferase